MERACHWFCGWKSCTTFHGITSPKVFPQSCFHKSFPLLVAVSRTPLLERLSFAKCKNLSPSSALSQAVQKWKRRLWFGNSDQSWKNELIALFAVLFFFLFYPLVQIWALLPLTNAWEKQSSEISIWMSTCKWAALVCNRNSSWRSYAFWLESKYANIGAGAGE